MPNEPEKKTPTPPVPPKDAPKPAPGVTPTPATAAPKVPTQPEKAADGKGPAAPVGKAQPQAGTMKPDPAAKTPEAGKDAAKDDKAPAQGEKKPAQPDKAVDGAAPVASDGKAQPQAGTVKPDPAAKTPEAKKDVDGKEAAKDGTAPAQGEKKPDEGKAPVAPDGKAQPQTGAAKQGRFTWVFIDEVYLYFKYHYSAEILYKAWKRFRKYGGILTAATQNVEECLQSETARLMLANSEFLMLFNQAATDRRELANLLHISDTQLGYITDAEPGHGLLRMGGVLVPFSNVIPKDTDLYRLMNTSPGQSR